MDWQGIAFTASVWVLPVLIAITFHEAAHGWTAWRLGDDTAYRLGRVTFNPFRHIDPFGTVLLPALLLFASGGRMMFGLDRKSRSEEHTSELQSRRNLVCRLLLEKKKKNTTLVPTVCSNSLIEMV